MQRGIERNSRQAKHFQESELKGKLKDMTPLSLPREHLPTKRYRVNNFATFQQPR